MADAEARRPKRRCAQSRYTSTMPSAIHYVGYVEEDETPEMIMAKFAELERIQKAAEEAAKQAVAQPQSDEASAPDGTTELGQEGDAVHATDNPTAPQGGQALSDTQLLEVFKQTSMFNVRTALQDNAMLMGIDEMLEYTSERYGTDEILSDDEDILRSFWSDDEDWGDDDASWDELSAKRSRRHGSGASRGPRGQRSASTMRARHSVVTAYNPATQALVRRRVRVDDPDEIVQIRVPPAPLPLSWGRTVKPYVPVHMRTERPEAVPSLAPIPAGQQPPEPPPCNYIELPSLASLTGDVKTSDGNVLSSVKYQAALINPGWERDGTGAAALSALSRLPLPRLVPAGFVFIWVPKHLVHPVCKQMAKWGYTYIENLTWVWMAANNDILTLPSRFVGASHLTLYMFRVTDGSGKGIELRHQRNPDVTFDCVAAAEGEPMGIPEETYVAIETLLPTGKGKLLELWSEKGVKRPGWTHVVEVGGNEA